METKKLLIIEGGDKRKVNGDLKKGFEKLLNQRLSDNSPKIVLGGGKFQSIHQFKTNAQKANFIFLLIDLDATETERENDVAKNNLQNLSNSIFYMIQSMEAWFLSQPNILDDFFGKDSNSNKKISNKIPKKKASQIPNPYEFLKNLTKNSKRGTYHKIKHAVGLLILLDAPKLEEDFIDFKRLIESLQ